MKQYRLVENDSLQDFEKQVSEAMADGWMPDGQLQRPNFGNVHYTQPMVREIFYDDMGNECVVRK